MVLMKGCLRTVVVGWLFFCGCSAPALRVHHGYATGFERGAIVADVRALPADSTDLREMALTLPILEDPSDHYRSLIYKHSESATSAESWDLFVDGAQSPVRVERLPLSRRGASGFVINDRSHLDIQVFAPLSRVLG